MSNTLLIRHLCADLTTSEREDFLKHFGAQKVWFINPSSHTAFASFATRSDAENALRRLHQLEVLGRRLTVEFSNKHSVPVGLQLATLNDDPLKTAINSLSYWNPSVNLLQPPPPHLSYKYPPSTPNTLFNIFYEVGRNIKLYVQILHLMNKMGLDPPFESINESVREYVVECLKAVNITTQFSNKNDDKVVVENVTEEFSEESEISSAEDDDRMQTQVGTALPVKRKSRLQRINKRPKILLQTNIMNNQPKNRKTYDAKEVFEERIMQENKKIKVKEIKVISSEAGKDDAVEIVGTIGKMAASEKLIIDNNDGIEKVIRDNNKLVSKDELLLNRISSKDMKVLPIFKDYHPGNPSMRLYIKNLSKEVTAQDVENIFRRYLLDCDWKESQMFDVRVMQEGRMKGQAFVTLPSVEISEKALQETNGYILKNKPMVVQFARTAK